MKRTSYLSGILLAAALLTGSVASDYKNPAIISSAQIQKTISKRRKEMALNGQYSGFRTPFLTNGNRAQRARQLGGMLAM